MLRAKGTYGSKVGKSPKKKAVKRTTAKKKRVVRKKITKNY